MRQWIRIVLRIAGLFLVLAGIYTEGVSGVIPAVTGVLKSYMRGLDAYFKYGIKYSIKGGCSKTSVFGTSSGENNYILFIIRNGFKMPDRENAAG
jgi:hypothetical protein